MVKPSLIHPFDPQDIVYATPGLYRGGWLCVGTCAVWSYVMYLAALKEGN